MDQFQCRVFFNFGPWFWQQRISRFFFPMHFGVFFSYKKKSWGHGCHIYISGPVQSVARPKHHPQLVCWGYTRNRPWKHGRRHSWNILKFSWHFTGKNGWCLGINKYNSDTSALMLGTCSRPTILQMPTSWASWRFWGNFGTSPAWEKHTTLATCFIATLWSWISYFVGKYIICIGVRLVPFQYTVYRTVCPSPTQNNQHDTAKIDQPAGYPSVILMAFRVLQR